MFMKLYKSLKVIKVLSSICGSVGKKKVVLFLFSNEYISSNNYRISVKIISSEVVKYYVGKMFNKLC